MEWSNFKAVWDKCSSQNITLRIALAALTLAIIAQSLVIVALYDKQRVVFVPPKIDREFYIASDGPSTSYLEMMGDHIASRVMVFTSSNVLPRFNSILPLLSPANYNEVKTMLARQAESIIKANISQIFYTSKIVVDEKLQTIGVFGAMRTMVVDQVSAEKTSVLWIKYRFVGGKFEIESLHVSSENPNNPFKPGAPVASR